MVYALADAGRDSEGEAMMRQALTLDPNLRYLFTRLGDLYRNAAMSRRRRRSSARPFVWLNARRATAGIRESGVCREALPPRGRLRSGFRIATPAVTTVQNERFGGDNSTRIAGPDSGFLQADERHEVQR